MAFYTLLLVVLFFSCSSDVDTINDSPNADSLSSVEILENSIFENGDRYLGNYFLDYDSLIKVEYSTVNSYSGSVRNLYFDLFFLSFDLCLVLHLGDLSFYLIFVRYVKEHHF